MNIEEIFVGQSVRLHHPTWQSTYYGVVIGKTDHAVTVSCPDYHMVKVHPDTVHPFTPDDPR